MRLGVRRLRYEKQECRVQEVGGSYHPVPPLQCTLNLKKAILSVLIRITFHKNTCMIFCNFYGFIYHLSLLGSIIAELRQPQAEPHNYRNRITCMQRNRNLCSSFLMVKMASSMDHGRVGLMTMTTTNDEQRHTTWRPSS